MLIHHTKHSRWRLHASKSQTLHPSSIVAMDVEYIHLRSPNDKEIMQAAQACFVLESHVVLNSHIRLPRELLNCSYIGGVRPCDLDSAPSLSEMKEKIVEIWSQGSYLVGHNLRKDLKYLGLQFDEGSCYDTMDFPPFQSSRGKKSSARTLKHLASEFLGTEIQATPGSHDIEEDALAVYQLFVKIVLPTLLKSEDEFLSYHEWVLSRSMSALQREKTRL